MITIPTVFVLGAGASAPYGYPTGGQLRDWILADLHKRGPVLEQLFGLRFLPDDLRLFAKRFRTADPESIDDFLGRHPDDTAMGKALIAAELVPYENESRLFDTWSSDLAGLSDEDQRRERAGRWYSYLWQRLMKTPTFEQLEGNRVSFITFNYDRSLEQYLFTVVKETYDKDGPSCAGMVSHFPIIHVYGQLGKLDWQDADKGRAYSPTVTNDRLHLAADSVKILSEGSEDSTEFGQARDLLLHANRVFFLGFGYHRENLRRLGVPGVLCRDRPPSAGNRAETAGTAFGLKRGERRAAKGLFKGTLDDLGPEDQDCLLFLRENESLVE
jgi:hypothetical protein